MTAELSTCPRDEFATQWQKKSPKNCVTWPSFTSRLTVLYRYWLLPSSVSFRSRVLFIVWSLQLKVRWVAWAALQRRRALWVRETKTAGGGSSKKTGRAWVSGSGRVSGSRLPLRSGAAEATPEINK